MDGSELTVRQRRPYEQWIWTKPNAKQNSIDALIKYNPAKDRFRGKLPIPQHAHPLVRRLFEIMNQQMVCMTDVAPRAGFRRRTLAEWGARRNPTITNFEAVLNALGYELRIVRRIGRNAE